MLVISPVFHRLNIGRWTSSSALSLHVLQVLSSYSTIRYCVLYSPCACVGFSPTTQTCWFIGHSKLPINVNVSVNGCLSGISSSPNATRLQSKQIFYNYSPFNHLFLHQVVLFPMAAVFFSCPIPEHLSPGRYDIIGHGHQLSHMLQCFCTLVQQEVLFRDFPLRRPAMVRTFGEEGLLLVCVSLPCHMLGCGMTALSLMWRAKAHKEQRQ